MVTLIFLYRTSMPARSIPYHLAQSAWDSVMRHLWHLAPDTVVICLVDPESSDVEKREVARGIVLHSPSSHHTAWKPHMPVLMPTNPSLASFVGTDSWKLWELLGVGHAWLSCRILVFSGTVHWFVGRQAFIHYCGLHQVWRETGN